MSRPRDNEDDPADGPGERRLVYTALAIACTVIALAAGPVVGIWSFLQVALIIEAANCVGRRRPAPPRRLW